VKASRAAMSGRLSWRAAYHPDIRKNTTEGAAIRAEMASRFAIEQRKVTEILGIEAGYRYVGSPVVWSEPGDGPDPDNPHYVPTTWPGARLPHVWLSNPATPNGRTALHDRLSLGYTLLLLGGTRVDTTNLERALRARWAPLDVVEIDDASAREICGFDLLLVRPDLHIVWRGNQIPEDVGAIAAIAIGRAMANVPSAR
jgi:hypothetical protein